MLVGEMWWHDEHPSGATVVVAGLRPHRLREGLQISPQAPGSSLELGIWTSDPSLLAAARTWPDRLIKLSPLEVGSGRLGPELLPVEYDIAAIPEPLAETCLAYDEEQSADRPEHAVACQLRLLVCCP
jgi:hypothetical protein